MLLSQSPVQRKNKLAILNKKQEAWAHNLLTIRRKAQRKIKKFSRSCYFEICFYQTLFWKDLSQKVKFTGKEIPAKNYKQLGYPTGLGEKFKGG